ncbi:kinase-like domain-containing protein [Cantharellus anzutake]|uniref:kinase-like domain-containing protein n=1 Tax=Cantharellus anzutake TaxID=1750568 RepID=UPI0019049F8A|nr:kinase-like domain-containing protein [Cantharellus anzutake]KAF8329719.1 kinase-like domain-containing protein [Cantharellus anzutake]
MPWVNPKIDLLDVISRPSEVKSYSTFEGKMIPITVKKRILSSECELIKIEDVPDTVEVLVTEDWRDGLELAKAGKPFYGSGYIGDGFSKIAIYGREGEHSLALCIPKQSKHTENEVKYYLECELRITGLAQQFAISFMDCMNKAVQDRTIRRNNFVNIRFNTDGMFIGTLVGKAPSISLEPVLPYDTFLATKFLPHPPQSRGFQKFTGSAGDVEPSLRPSEQNTMDAFQHYTYRMSGGKFLITDLQGIWSDSADVSCWMLFDPQGHSSEFRSDGTNSGLGYFDEGVRAMNDYLSRHKCNKICTLIGLDADSESDDGSGKNGLDSSAKFGDTNEEDED